MTERRRRWRWRPLRQVRQHLSAIAVVLVIVLPMTRPDPVDGAMILYYPLGVRSIGMGESGVSDRTDPGNAYLNPANVTAVNGFYSTGSYRLLFPQFSDEYSLGHVSLGFGRTLKDKKPFRLAFDLTYAGLKYGENYRENYVAVTAGMNVATGEHTELALGLAFKHWMAKTENARTVFRPEGVGPTDASANLFDVGAVVTVNLDASGWRVRPMFGLSLLNMGPDIESAYSTSGSPPPTWFKYGITTQVESPHVMLGTASVPTVSATLNFQGSHGLEEQSPVWGIGAEIALVQAIFVRWGRRMDDDFHLPVSMWGAALGIPAGAVRLRLEYANLSAPTGYLDPNNDEFGFTFVYLFDGD